MVKNRLKMGKKINSCLYGDIHECSFCSPVDMTKLKMNPFRRGIVSGIVLMAVLDVIVVKKFYVQNTKHIRTTTNFNRTKLQLGHFQNLTLNTKVKSKCKVDIVNNLTTSGLKKNPRRKEIPGKEGLWHPAVETGHLWDCNHITLNEDYHNNIMYDNLLVDDMHKVSGCFYRPVFTCLSVLRVFRLEP